MDLTDSEDQFLRGMRAIRVNDEGREVFVGLTAAESEEYLALSRRGDRGEDISKDLRFLELQKRHEAERQSIVNGEKASDPSFHAR